MGNGLTESRAAQALVLADGGPDDGLGHLSRSGAVANALSALGFCVRCLALGAEKEFCRDGMHWDRAAEQLRSPPLPSLPAVVVFDSYRNQPPTIKASTVLCAMHDRFPLPPGSICVAVGRAPESGGPDGVDILAGPQFACLRPDFWDVEARPIATSPSSVLVSTGAGDEAGSALELATKLASTLPGLTVRVVRGPQARAAAAPGVDVIDSPASLRDPLLEADLAVLGGGQTMLEALACGVPTVAMPLAENQRAQVQYLADEGAVMLAEDPEVARDRLTELVCSVERRRILSTRARSMVDGRGALRVAEHIQERLS